MPRSGGAHGDAKAIAAEPAQLLTARTEDAFEPAQTNASGEPSTDLARTVWIDHCNLRYRRRPTAFIADQSPIRPILVSSRQSPMTNDTTTSFSRLPLPPATIENLQRLGYTAMTPIQAASLPLALAGKDLIAQAKTGSGKTAAFALALLANLNPRRFAVQALVLCPTRELADQVTQEVRRLARAEDHIKVLTLCGGSTMRPQLASLEHGAHIVVGTPGRIMDHLERGSLNLEALNTLVLDEADRMLDMGFHDDIATVARQCPKQRQTLLFSATYPEGIAKLSAAFMRDPQTVTVAEQHSASKIRQLFFEVREDERLHAVSLLLNHYRPVSTLAFCNTKQQCRNLVDVLKAQGFAALELHGDLDQRERDQVLVQFSNRSCSVLVATDIAARGLDITGLEAVINVDVTPDPATHTHRIGRTGRVDAEGWAFSLASLDEMGRVGQIEHLHGFTSQWQPLASLTPTSKEPLRPPMSTLQIVGGRKEKIRPGDVLGALTKDLGYAAAQIGKINVNEFSTYVAVERGVAAQVLKKLSTAKVKGRAVKVRMLEG
jgi:ATP-dependent RNA helicase DbpA